MIGRVWDCITILLLTAYPPLDRQQGKNTFTRFQSPSSPTRYTPESPPYRSTLLGTGDGIITRSFGYYGRNQGFIQISTRKAISRAGF